MKLWSVMKNICFKPYYYEAVNNKRLYFAMIISDSSLFSYLHDKVMYI